MFQPRDVMPTRAQALQMLRRAAIGLFIFGAVTGAMALVIAVAIAKAIGHLMESIP